MKSKFLLPLLSLAICSAAMALPAVPITELGLIELPNSPSVLGNPGGATNNTIEQDQQKLTNEDVIKMVKAGLSPQIIEQTINSSDQAFDVSTDALIKLKQEGVPDAIVQAMILRAKNGGKPGAYQNPDLDCGGDSMFLIDGTKRVELKYSNTESRTALGVGALVGRGKGFVTLKGSRAETRVTNSSPTFEELYLPIGMRPDGAAILAKLDIKSDRREIEVASISAITFSSGEGIPKNRRMPIAFEEVPEQTCMHQGKKYRHVKIKVTSPLMPGEYSIIIGNYFFDFGLDPKQ
ncbi:MAG TPA: hypothetical protein VN643_27190 [Pyrinomonadaceae bacterium]|nr:hypothetical protein [Pyrinomonadaceae bacterium]